MALKIGKYYGSDSSMDNSPGIQIKETLDSGYNDITSITTWMTVGPTYYDYLFCREQAISYLESNPWSGQTNNNKIIAAKHFLTEDQTQLDEVLTSEEQFKHWGTFVVQSKICRCKRWDLGKNYASFMLSKPDMLDLATSTNSLSVTYKEYGIESNIIDGVDGLIDWLQATSGYVGGGFPLKGYHTQEIEDKLVSILTNGY